MTLPDVANLCDPCQVQSLLRQVSNVALGPLKAGDLTALNVTRLNVTGPPLRGGA